MWHPASLARYVNSATIMPARKQGEFAAARCTTHQRTASPGSSRKYGNRNVGSRPARFARREGRTREPRATGVPQGLAFGRTMAPAAKCASSHHVAHRVSMNRDQAVAPGHLDTSLGWECAIAAVALRAASAAANTIIPITLTGVSLLQGVSMSVPLCPIPRPLRSHQGPAGRSRGRSSLRKVFAVFASL